MTRLALSALLLTTGCVIYEDGGPHPGPSNVAPVVIWADAGCYWDNYYYDDIWYFEAEADDGDGVYDVVAVYADVYDAWTGRLEDSFELYPTNDPYYWFSDWLGSTTWLDCGYGGYVVDFVAYDSYDAYDVLTVEPWTYAH